MIAPNVESNTKSKFSIYFAQQRQRREEQSQSKQLILGNTIYDTLVDGIDEAIREKDFRGILKIKYDLNGEMGHLIFALWFCPKTKTHFLTSLGQHSESSYHNDVERYQNGTHSGNRMHIRLFPIHSYVLDELEGLLDKTHLSQANVMILKETVIH
ncbi:MAG: hypothetical protein V3V31_03500 [Methylococcales bacterium]